MRLAALELFSVAIPFRFTFRHALAARSASDALLVRVRSKDGAVGHGECLPRDYVTGETGAAAVRALLEELFPRFIGARWTDFEEVVAALEGEAADLPRERHAAFCALELALLDLAGQAFAADAAAPLGTPVRDEVRYSAVVSADGPVAAAAVLEGVAQRGFAQVKLKVGLDRAADLATLAAARARLGPAAGLRVDANCAFTADEALARLDAWRPFGLEAIEQPLAAGDLDGLARVVADGPTPVVVDESLVTLEDARRLIDAGACHGFNVRLSKNGGLLQAGRLARMARGAGLRVQLGAQVGETAVLSAAGRQFACRVPDLWFAEGSYGRLLLEEDLAVADLTVGAGGRAPRLAGPGLGVAIDEAAFTRRATRLGGVT